MLACGDKDDDCTFGSGSSSDGGAADGGAGDGGSIEGEPVETLICTSSSEVTAEVFGESTECRCTVTSNDRHSYVIHQLVVRMDVPDADGDDCNDFDFWRPAGVAVSPAWVSGFSGIVGTSAGGEHDCDDEATSWQTFDIEDYFDRAAALKGTYDLRLQLAGELTDCDWLGDHGVTLDIYGEATVEGSGSDDDDAARLPILIPENPLDIDELDMACTADTTTTTDMQLLVFPGWSHPVPVGIDGARQHLFGQATAVSVSDWADTDELVLTAQDGTTVTLDSSSSSATLSGGVWPMGGIRWTASASTSPFQLPVVTITHACPSSFPSARRLVDQAYALDLDTIDQALDDATGGTGLGDIMTIADDTDWPVVVARVYPIEGGPDVDGYTHVLDFEIQGSRVHSVIPLTQTELGRWDLDYDTQDWDIEGTVARNPGKLTLDLDDGSVTTQSGTLDLDPVTLDLLVYPEEQ